MANVEQVADGCLLYTWDLRPSGDGWHPESGDPAGEQGSGAVCGGDKRECDGAVAGEGAPPGEENRPVYM